jgi:hypothetical protein
METDSITGMPLRPIEHTDELDSNVNLVVTTFGTLLLAVLAAISAAGGSEPQFYVGAFIVAIFVGWIVKTILRSRFGLENHAFKSYVWPMFVVLILTGRVHQAQSGLSVWVDDGRVYRDTVFLARTMHPVKLPLGFYADLEVYSKTADYPQIPVVISVRCDLKLEYSDEVARRLTDVDIQTAVSAVLVGVLEEVSSRFFFEGLSPALLLEHDYGYQALAQLRRQTGIEARGTLKVQSVHVAFNSNYAQAVIP